MTTKQQIMEAHFEKYGKATSAFQLAGILRKRFPSKKESYLQEVRDFLNQKLTEHRQVERVVYIPAIKSVRNPRYFNDSIHNFIRWMCCDHELSVLQQEFTEAFTGLKWQPVLA